MNKPVKIYSDTIEGKALAQFHSAMKMDFAVQGALMPDAHAGYALPIGAVVATKDVIVPSWIGYDIGCGVCAVPTTFDRYEVEVNKKAIFDQIYRDVPVGFSHNKMNQPYAMARAETSAFVARELILQGAPNKQIGTLGGGNHFIEIGYDETNRVWIVIHSGSRNVGHKIATHYMKLASGDGKAREGHHALPVDSADGQDYIKDLAFGLQFALDNRVLIMGRVIDAICRIGVKGDGLLANLINRNHNHAELKNGLWVHRKGATHAELGMMGVIPGNMRDGSFVVCGRGCADSLCSSSHGAGRVMGRAEAKSKLDMTEFIKTMQERGIQARVEGATLDEAPMAYKNIFEVMADQVDLVDVIHHIKPLINIKG